jgi:hypothetical protein
MHDALIEIASTGTLSELLGSHGGSEMIARSDWPEWWNWEIELCDHLLEQMVERQFNEADLRLMLEDATGITPDFEQGRWLVSTVWGGKPWEVIVEPDFGTKVLVVVTAYMLG